MANDPRDLDGSRLARALLQLGRDETLRAELMQWLQQAEQRLAYSGSVRDDISGPIMDALHTDNDRYEKQLADGTRFQFLYRTKIARDFLLAGETHPSHVWEPQTTRLLHHLAANTTADVLIGGAYFGDHAIVLGRQLASAQRKVHCFEPNSAQAGMLAINAQLNQLDNLLIHQVGLWHESNRHLRLDGFDSFANAVVVDSRSDDSFPTTTIDDYCAAHGRPLGVIMLDIEGAELSALQGAKNVLAHDRPAVVFEVHRDYVDWSAGLLKTPICTLLTQAGYTLFAVRDLNTHLEMQGRSIELIAADTVYLDGPPHGFNMLAVPGAAMVTGPAFRHVAHVSPKLLRHKDPALHHPLDGFPAGH